MPPPSGPRRSRSGGASTPSSGGANPLSEARNPLFESGEERVRRRYSNQPSTPPMSRKVLTAILVPAAALAAAGVSAASTSVQVPGSPFHGKRGHVRHATVTAGRPAVTWQIPTGSDAAAYWTPERMQSAQPYPMGRAPRGHGRMT